MRMKKAIILAGLLLATVDTVLAEQRGVFMEFHRKTNPEKNMEVNRTLIRLPIEVIYDSDTHIIEVIGEKSMKAEIYLYDINGTLKDYSSTLNSDFTVSTSGTYIIQIQGDKWHAEGKIEM